VDFAAFPVVFAVDLTAVPVFFAAVFAVNASSSSSSSSSSCSSMSSRNNFALAAW